MPETYGAKCPRCQGQKKVHSSSGGEMMARTSITDCPTCKGLGVTLTAAGEEMFDFLKLLQTTGHLPESQRR